MLPPSRTPTVVPSRTLALKNAPKPYTSTVAPTLTANPKLQTLTATLSTGTVVPSTFDPPSSPSATAAPETATSNTPTAQATPTEKVPQPQFYGTLPPAVRSGTIILSNRAETKVYVSLRCAAKNENVTILEYPVKQTIDIFAPSGQYNYVAGVGGRQFTEAFSLLESDVRRIELIKNKVTIE